MKKKNRIVVRCMGAVYLVLLMAWMSGCASQPDSRKHMWSKGPSVKVISTSQQMACDFDTALPEAVGDLCNGMEDAITVLEEDLNHGIDGMVESAGPFVETLDGYWNRMKGNATRDMMVDEWMHQNIEEYIVPAIDKYFELYGENIQGMEMCLLVETGMRDRVQKMREQLLHEIQTGHAHDITCKEMSGDAGGKIADDAVGMIPILGDAYDLYKAFVYDKRLENAKIQARQVTRAKGTILCDAVLIQIRNIQPKPEDVTNECRKQFEPSKAVQKLTRERL